MNCICPMNFFRTTDTTIWKPGLTESEGRETHHRELRQVPSPYMGRTQQKRLCISEMQVLKADYLHISVVADLMLSFTGSAHQSSC